ncbi:MAG: MBL fold metallo-hydrolase [Dysgonomonas sp.]
MTIKIFQFNPVGENTYVLYDETKECVIIDAGCFFPEEKETLSAFISDNQLNVKLLLNTHLHFDHVLGNTFVKEQYGLDTWAHEADKFLLEGLPMQMQMFGFSPVKEIPAISRFLKEGDEIEFGNQQLKVIHVPGHSPGSVVFYNEKEGFMIVGDVLFQMSIGRTDLPGGDHYQLVEGIHQKLLVLPPETVVYPGHGSQTTIGFETKNNPYL